MAASSGAPPQAGRRFAPYERFAAGKTSAQGQFTAQPLTAPLSYGCGVPLAGACPEHVKSNRGPRRALARWGMAAKARYEHLTRLVELYK